jgi:16S rRNA (adenine1518-N6/adenine1519-N6)-dimethyltransferase
MNLYSKRIIRNLLKKYKTKPLKALGQNFLIDRGIIKKIIKSAELNSKDIVLEIGPGIGTLTAELAKIAKRIIAVEKDPKMVKILKETLKDFKNVKIVQGDILKIQNSKFKIQNSFKVVANLPYYITSAVIRKFLESKDPSGQMTLMIQKEVAQRICARPPDMNLLAVSVQFYAEPKIISYVSKKSFWPQPKVNSAIIRINPLIITERKLININLFFKIVRAGFSQPRKQLINNLTKNLKIDKIKIREWFLKNNIKPEQRAETLSIMDWIKLAKTMKT